MAREFSTQIKKKVLLWCDRHCCLCGKACGVNIAVHHIDPTEKNDLNDIENAIPLCFNCHGAIHAYDEKRAMGNKYRVEELKARRNQIYERYTRHLVPPVDIQITQYLPNGKKGDFPKVRFILTHLENYLPVKVRTILNILLDGKKKGHPDSGYYAGNKLWRLNPRRAFYTPFKIPDKVAKKVIEGKKRLEIEINTTIIDQYDRKHELLPIGFMYQRKEGSNEDNWYSEP